MTVKLAFAIVSLTIAPAIAPAIAQGISNKRDVSGNLPRDKGVSAATIHRAAMVSPAVSPTQPTVPARARGLVDKHREQPLQHPRKSRR
jgi:hypothetical protein